MMKVEDLMGKKFGSLTVEERKGSDKHGRARWLCRCDCGQMTIVASHNLKYTLVRSCGCSRRASRVTL